uniref:Uncharacterized protein n=1 Tax=Anguilla anguilla TaxID=7936 RepID=A0A0E9R3X1_ANGAN
MSARRRDISLGDAILSASSTFGRLEIPGHVCCLFWPLGGGMSFAERSEQQRRQPSYDAKLKTHHFKCFPEVENLSVAVESKCVIGGGRVCGEGGNCVQHIPHGSCYW